MDTTRRNFFKGAFKLGGAALIVPAVLTEPEPTSQEIADHDAAIFDQATSGYAVVDRPRQRVISETVTITMTDCGPPLFYRWGKGAAVEYINDRWERALFNLPKAVRS